MANKEQVYWEDQEEEFDFKAFFWKYLRYWYWFVISAVIALVGAYFYVRQQVPIYKISAVLLIKDESKGGMATSEALKDLELYSSNKIIENEIELLKSRAMLERVVNDLKLTTSYYQKGKIRSEEEIFGTCPLWVQAGTLTPLAYAEPMWIKVLNKNEFQLQDEDGTIKGKFGYSQNVKSDYGSFRVFLIDSLYRHDNDLIQVRFASKDAMIQHYQNALQIELVNQKSTVLRLSIEDALPQKGKAVLSKLLEAYSFSALADKNREATNTMQFIDDRLRLITGELGDVEKDVETYKSSQGITDLSAEANLFLEKVKENDSKLNEVDIQLKVLDGVEAYLKSSQLGVAPATLMVSDPVLTGLLSKLNELDNQREKLARTTAAANPLLETVNTQITNTKAAIRENINNQRESLVITRNSLKSLNGRFETAIRTIPRKEREFINIKRQQGIKESLYLLLLEKREETAISYASTVTDSRVVDEPYSSPGPVRPKPNMIYLAALLLGLGVPFAVLSVKAMLNDKIESRTEIEDKTRNIPILGEIGQRPKEVDGPLLDTNKRNFIVEQFRILRTNLNYLFKGDLAVKKVLITSTITGEGKSFVSLNLASSLAKANHKVVLINADIRKPKLHEYLGIPNEVGVVNYLIGRKKLDEILLPTRVENLTFIASGPVPPNPAELLGSEAMKKLIEELSQRFEYILIDCSPHGLVTDALLVAPLVDVTLYLVRHDHTPKTALSSLAQLAQEKKMPSLSLVYNGVKAGGAYGYSYGYGYGYGYGYYGEEDKVSWWKRWRKKI